MNEPNATRRRIALFVLILLVLVAATVAYYGWHRHNTARREAEEAVFLYISLTEVYSAPAVWPVLRYASPRDLTRNYNLLSTVTPPPEMEEAHQNLLEGYKNCFEGQKLILQSHNDGELRSEGEFLISWGLSRIQEHYRVIEAYRESHPQN